MTRLAKSLLYNHEDLNSVPSAPPPKMPDTVKPGEVEPWDTLARHLSLIGDLQAMEEWCLKRGWIVFLRMMFKVVLGPPQSCAHTQTISHICTSTGTHINTLTHAF